MAIAECDESKARMNKRVEANAPVDKARAGHGILPSEQGELFYLMHEVSRMVSVYFDASLKPHNITHAQWWMLMHVNNNKGVTQTRLAHLMQMGRAAAGKLLERMERGGWVERRDDPRDHRVRRVFLSARGEATMAVMAAEGEKLCRAFLSDIPVKEQRAMLASMRNLRANALRAAGQAEEDD